MSNERSSRHSKIIGQFGEHLVCNFLSRSNFEVAIVDHTGIDLIASRSGFPRPLGISVKSRTSRAGNRPRTVRLSKTKKESDFEKLRKACEWFGCEPWIAVYFEWDSNAKLYLTRLEHYKAMCEKEGKNASRWSMSAKRMSKYESDPEVLWIDFTFDKTDWSDRLPPTSSEPESENSAE